MPGISGSAQNASDLSRHPYYPTTLALLNYVPNARSLESIVQEFVLAWIVVLCLSWTVTKLLAKGLSLGEKLTVQWFVLCKSQNLAYE